MKRAIHLFSFIAGFLGGVLLIFGPGIFEVMSSIPGIALSFAKKASISKNLEPWMLGAAYLFLSAPLFAVYLSLQRLFWKSGGSKSSASITRTAISFFAGVLAAYVTYYILFLYAVSRFTWF